MSRSTRSIIVLPVAAMLAGCAQTLATTASAGPDTPGWTGRTVVVGSNSTINGDRQGTYWAQKWGIGRQR